MVWEFTLAAGEFGEESNTGREIFQVPQKGVTLTESFLCYYSYHSQEQSILTLYIALWKLKGHCQFHIWLSEAFVTLR